MVFTVMKFFTLFFLIEIALGSPLWTLPEIINDVDFAITQDNTSVRINAFINNPDAFNVNYAKSIKFVLFNRKNKQGIQLETNGNVTLFSIGFDFNSSNTKILIHGFADNIFSDFNKLLRKAYLRRKNLNVIAVDWSDLCLPPFYAAAVDNARQVGKRVAQLIVWLMTEGVSLSKIHMVGYSVGAHIAGIVSHHLRGTGRVSRITGLDPAKPMFELNSRDQLLTSDDADFVDCVHTCGGYLGVSEPVCTVDFYPNGGVDPQPGCKFDFFGKCSHQRAYQYFAESILHPGAFSVALRCSAVEGYSPVNCSVENNVTMGEHTDVRVSGIFYLATAFSSPFSLKKSTNPVNFLTQFLWNFH